MTRQRVLTQPCALTYAIIGEALALHGALGSGHEERTYQAGLEARLREKGWSFESQRRLPVYAASHSKALVGYYIPDLIVENTVVVESKAQRGLDDSHLDQVAGYLAVTGCPVGLLINFGGPGLQWKRVFRPKAIPLHRVNRQWLWVPEWLR